MVSGLRGSRLPPALVVSVLPPAGGGTVSCVVPYHGGGVGRGARLLPPLSRIRRLGHHLRRRLCAVHGGRGPPYHSGSCPPGFSGYDLCGVPVRRPGPACSSRPPCEPAAGAGGRVTLRLPSRAGGAHPPCLGGWGPGPQRPAGWWQGGGGGLSRRGLPVLAPGGGLRYSFPALSVSRARSLPARACGRG